MKYFTDNNTSRMTLMIKVAVISIVIHLYEAGSVIDNGVRITDPDGSGEDAFGSAVAINRDYVIISSRRDGYDGKAYSGSVCVHANNKKFTHLRKLVAEDANDFDEFGSSVAINRRFVVVGSSRSNNPNRGSAYVYSINNNWKSQKLVPKDLFEENDFGEYFGSAVGINEDNDIVIGAPDAINEKGHYSGLAYIFSYENRKWIQKQVLSPSNTTYSDKLGNAVSITKEYIALSAHDDSTQGWFTGAVHIYKKNSKGLWQEETTIYSPNPSNDGMFGKAVSLSGNRLVVGAPNEALEKGNVYVYKREGANWELETTLVTTNHSNRNTFGSSVSIYRNIIIVSSYTDVAHAFGLSNGRWVEKNTLIVKGGEEREIIYSIDMRNNQVIFGCRSDAIGKESGAAYSFKL